MTLNRIVNELEKRDAVLAGREATLRQKIYECRYQKPFSDLTDKELEQNWELSCELNRLEQPFRERIMLIHDERIKIRNMLYEFRHSRG